MLNNLLDLKIVNSKNQTISTNCLKCETVFYSVYTSKCKQTYKGCSMKCEEIRVNCFLLTL